MTDPRAVALIVFTDGRDDLLDQTLESFRVNVHGLFTRRIIHDDTGKPEHAAALAERYKPRGFDVINGHVKLGFGGAIDHVWTFLREFLTEPYVFHCEDDFTFKRHVYLDALINVLEVNPQVCQLALRRQPWNAHEQAAGGVVETDPAAFEDRVSGERRHEWLEHRKFFTTNPSLYRRELLDLGWPTGQFSEGHFTQRCLGAGRTFGYWGARASGEWVHHTGHERAGTGY